MIHFLFFFTVASLIRTLGNILKITPKPIFIKRVGVFLFVIATWFVAIAFNFWSSFWPTLILALIAAALPYDKIFAREDSFYLSPHSVIDVISLITLGLLAVPMTSLSSILIALSAWLMVSLVVDVCSRAILSIVPSGMQKLAMIFAVAFGIAVFIFNPSEVVNSTNRMLSGRLLTVGLANPFARFQAVDTFSERLSETPYEIVSHNQLLLDTTKDNDVAADPDTYLPLIRNEINGIPANRFAPEYGEVVHSPIDIQFPNPTFTGNPFDLIAKVTFTHPQSGEQRVTEMFYVGDDTWTARFTATREGRWIYQTISDDSDLDGKSGELDIDREPGLAGFVSYERDKWVRTGNPSTGFVPQFMMYKDPDRYYNNPAVIDADIQEYMVGHGFNGLHVNVYCRWFELEKPRCGDITSASPNPDMRTFEALELLITKVHAQGGVVHIWAWGDSQRTQNPERWGYNGVEDQRLQRYIAARLGPIPGWTMGYGFDLFEWTNEEHLDRWVEYMHTHMGWSHMLGARSYKNEIAQISERMDYSGYEQHWPDYDTYVASILDRADKPSFSEDRFRIDGKGKNKDYTPDMTRQGLWRSMMSGGIANIWGNLNLSNGGSYEIGSIPYPNKAEIKLYFTYSEKWYGKELERCNQLTDGYCLKNRDNNRFVFYKENTNSIQVNLTSMGQDAPFVAINTISGQKIEGTFSSSNLTWNAPSTSDWVIAVGDFE